MRRFLWIILAALSIPCFSQMSFDNVETRTAFGKAASGDNGHLIMDAKKIAFAKKTDGSQEYFSIPTGAVKELFYSRVAGRRIGAAILVTPLLLFSKGRKHYLTISFNDGANLAGAVEFKLHKSNYRGILRSAEEVSGLTMHYDQEGVKETVQTVATRGEQAQGVLEITSVPEGAEIEIDGVFVGQSPRSRKVASGDHLLRLRNKGYKDWERKVSVEAGETLAVRAEMEPK